VLNSAAAVAANADVLIFSLATARALATVSQAVAHGRWLLREDVDRAPLEVMASLAPFSLSFPR
jgi:hypothetical protein